MAAKDVKFAGDARDRMLRGVDVLANAVKVTLGDVMLGRGDDRRPATDVEDLVTGERHALEWGGIRLRLDPARDPALLLRCVA